MNQSERETIASLRHQGYAVIIWTPEELDGVDPGHVEDRAIEVGWEVIDDLK